MIIHVAFLSSNFVGDKTNEDPADGDDKKNTTEGEGVPTGLELKLY